MKDETKDSLGTEKMTFEVAFDKLQATVKRLESGELSLEHSLRDFEEGVRLTRLCQEFLNQAEQRVEILMNPAKIEGEKSDRGAGEQPEFLPFQNNRM